VPLSWIICPISHEILELNDCLHCADEQLERPRYDAPGQVAHCTYSYPFLKRIATQAEGRKHAGFSATMATGCLRQNWLQQHTDYAIEPGEQVAAADGTAWHDWLESANEPSVLAEFRIRVTLPSGRVVTGKLDRLKRVPERLRSPEDSTLMEFWYEDMKRKADEVFEHAPDYYAWQLNIYRTLLAIGGEIVERDHQKFLKLGETLRCNVTQLRLLPSSHTTHGAWVNVPTFPHEVVVGYLEECAQLYGEATLACPPPPKYTSPATNSFCGRFCPVRSTCLQYGGESYDVMDLHNEKLFAASGIDQRWKSRRKGA
jgi:hypothetical protein